ncbi:MAG: hypothetical protein U9Q06_03345 [Nanoarchaeota archaeon]|nr:hypothetical protein [Nanoarchaeota archaeon]
MGKNLEEAREIEEKTYLDSLSKIDDLIEKKDKESLYKLRDSLVSLVNADLISKNSLENFIKSKTHTFGAGLATTVLYLTSHFKEMAKATEIGFAQEYGFLACTGEINDLRRKQGRFSDLDYAEGFSENAGWNSTYEHAEGFKGVAGNFSMYEHAEEFEVAAGWTSTYGHAKGFSENAGGNSTYEHAEEFEDAAGWNSTYEHAEEFKDYAGGDSIYGHAEGFTENAGKHSKMPPNK